jgi:limonene-1,2-epoxide hydrolase
MSEAGTRALVAGFYEDFNSGDIDAAVAAFSEDLETIDPGMGTVHGIEPFREYLQTFKRAMPDARAVPLPAYSRTAPPAPPTPRGHCVWLIWRRGR